MIKGTNTGKKTKKVKWSALVEREWIRGEVLTSGSITVTPVSRRVSLGLPSWMRPDQGWVFICQRPAALIVKRGESTQTIRIHDVQQIIILTLFALTALCLYILSRPKRTKRITQLKECYARRKPNDRDKK